MLWSVRTQLSKDFFDTVLSCHGLHIHSIQTPISEKQNAFISYFLGLIICVFSYQETVTTTSLKFTDCVTTMHSVMKNACLNVLNYCLIFFPHDSNSLYKIEKNINDLTISAIALLMNSGKMSLGVRLIFFQNQLKRGGKSGPVPRPMRALAIQKLNSLLFSTYRITLPTNIMPIPNKSML